MSDPAGRWRQGADEIAAMINQGDLDDVEASDEHAELLMDQAEGHLQAAGPLVQGHPPSAYALLYDAARKAMTSVLAKQGLRPTRAGGHVAVQYAIEAQMGPNIRHVVRPFRSLRRRRNESEYPSIENPPVTQDEAAQALDEARAIVERTRTFLPMVGPFR